MRAEHVVDALLWFAVGLGYAWTVWNLGRMSRGAHRIGSSERGSNVMRPRRTSSVLQFLRRERKKTPESARRDGLDQLEQHGTTPYRRS